jgi:alpha-tubulin suppressor-like RCC1 family protein
MNTKSPELASPNVFNVAARKLLFTVAALLLASATVVSAGEWRRSNNTSVPRSLTRISAGSVHSLFITKDGKVCSFGDNGGIFQTLGRPVSTIADCITPNFVIKDDGQHLNNIVGVAAGYTFSMALDSKGTVWTWGRNESEQLGRPISSTTMYAAPIEFNSASKPIAIAAGASHALALLADGTVVAWGSNSESQCGQGEYECGRGRGNSSFEYSYVPKLVLRENGIIECDTTPGDGLDNKVPISTSTVLRNVIAIAAGQSHSLALCSDGTVWAWGANDFNQLGNPNLEASMFPRYGLATKVQMAVSNNPPVDLTDIIGIECGHKHSIAVRVDGYSFAWGRNSNGELGVCLTDQKVSTATRQMLQTNQLSNLTPGPTDVGGVIAVVAGGANSMVLCGNGKIYTSGVNSYGERGEISSQYLVGLREVSDQAGQFPFGVSEISMGHHHSLIMGPDRSYRSWGANESGQLGIIPNSFANWRMVLLTGIPAGTPGTGLLALDGSINHTMALKGDGRVINWGSNSFKQLGNTDRSGDCTYSSDLNTMSTLSQTKPSVQLSSGGGNNPLQGVIGIACGHNHSHALLANGKVMSWGDYSMGTLGNSNSRKEGKACEPTPQKSATEVCAVAVESGHRFEGQHLKTASFVLAVTDNGKVLSWGKNMALECARRRGDPNDLYATPGYVIDSTSTGEGGTSLEGIVSVGVCGNWAVALDSKGRLWRWGGYPTLDESYPDVTDREFVREGSLGKRGVSCARLVPGDFNNNFKAVSAASNHVIALKADGTVWQLEQGLTQVSKSILTSVRSVACGGKHNLALMADGTVRTWGWNSAVNGSPIVYQLARQTIGKSDGSPASAVLVENGSRRIITDVAAIGAGMLYSLALMGDGSMWVSGHNTDGANGDINVGSYYDRFTKLSNTNLYLQTEDRRDEEFPTASGVDVDGARDPIVYSAAYVFDLLSSGSWRGNKIDQIGIYDINGSNVLNCSPADYPTIPDHVCDGVYFARLVSQSAREIILCFVKD